LDVRVRVLLHELVWYSLDHSLHNLCVIPVIPSTIRNGKDTSVPILSLIQVMDEHVFSSKLHNYPSIITGYGVEPNIKFAVQPMYSALTFSSSFAHNICDETILSRQKCY
jgi:hypothetical protein